MLVKSHKLLVGRGKERIVIVHLVKHEINLHRLEYCIVLCYGKKRATAEVKYLINPLKLTCKCMHLLL
jgi:hypothetical protein